MDGQYDIRPTYRFPNANCNQPWASTTPCLVTGVELLGDREMTGSETTDLLTSCN